jgi:hypothetical protein
MLTYGLVLRLIELVGTSLTSDIACTMWLNNRIVVECETVLRTRERDGVIMKSGKVMNGKKHSD